MTKFAFRLEKLLDYRRQQEKSAKDAYLESRARRIDTEHDIEGLQNVREKALSAQPKSIEDRRQLDGYLVRLDDERRGLEAARAVLLDDEEAYRQAWLKAKQDSDALQKLRDEEFAVWLKAVNKKEQDALDEWSVTRRAA
ncbi:flagellar FliJ family protein [Kamptonema cortianum]|nr:flagellar FliJ family protein [Geitlerinema splendidum]MDK3158344.1 flagellar FliJ family protein [Kamptonema cortianum]